MVISDESKGYSEDLLKTNYNNPRNLVEIFKKAIEKAEKPYSEFDVDGIAQLLPETPIKFIDSGESVRLFFPEFPRIKKLQELFKKPITELNSAQDIFLQALKIFTDYIANNDPDIFKQINESIQKYKHVFEQQLVSNKFLSEVCHKPLNYDFIKEAIGQCNVILADSLEKAIKSLKIDLGEDSLDRYIQAVDYLKLYANDPEVKKQLAIGYNKIACKLDEQGKHPEAVTNYIKALESNPELPEVYKRLGEILFENKQYSAASKCFKAVGALDEMEICFQKIIESKPNDPNVRKDLGDYNLFLEDKKGAIKNYTIAFFNSFNDAELHSIIEEKLNDIKAEKSKLSTKFKEFMASEKKCNDDPFTLAELKIAIKEIPKPAYNLVVEQSNPTDAACNDNFIHEVDMTGKVELNQ